MRALLILPLLPALLSTQPAFADDQEAEGKAAYEAWYAKNSPKFDSDWLKIQAAEKASRPIFDAAVKELKAGNAEKAEGLFLKARKTLFDHKHGDVVPVDRGLSHEIAVQLSEIYDERGDLARLKRELLLLDKGRKWLPEEKERLVYLNLTFKAERQNAVAYQTVKKREPRKVKKAREAMIAYLGVQGGKIYPEGRAIYKAWTDATREAEYSETNKLYRELDVQVNYHSPEHTPGGPFKLFEKPLIHVPNAKVTKVKGRKAYLDFKAARKVPYNCKLTNRIHSIDRHGRVNYVETCKWKKQQGGHILVVPIPKTVSVKIKKGDLISFYAGLDSWKKKWEAHLDKPAFVQVVRKNKSIWMLGVKTDKKMDIEAEQFQWHLHMRDPGTKK